jgi:hypothetical protein
LKGLSKFFCGIVTFAKGQETLLTLSTISWNRMYFRVCALQSTGKILCKEACIGSK